MERGMDRKLAAILYVDVAQPVSARRATVTAVSIPGMFLPLGSA